MVEIREHFQFERGKSVFPNVKPGPSGSLTGEINSQVNVERQCIPYD